MEREQREPRRRFLGTRDGVGLRPYDLVVNEQNNDRDLEQAVWERTDADGELRMQMAGFDALRRVPILGKWLLRRSGLEPDEVEGMLRQPERLVSQAAESIATFAPLGWAYSGLAPTQTYDDALNVLRSGGTTDEAEEVLVEGWDGSLKHFIMRVHGLAAGNDAMRPIVQRRAVLITKALDHHENGAYEASVPILFSQIDGICLDLTGKYFFKDPKREPLADKETVAGLPENLEVVRDWYSRPQRSSGATGESRRHGVMHGRELRYDTKRNSVKAFVLLLGVIEWAQPQARRAAEAAQLQREERYAGSLETDEDGRRLDRRGFDVAKESLRRLATRQMAEHRRHGRYSEMDQMFPNRSGDDFLHGQDRIEMRLSNDGQMFMAWRCATTGYVFSIAGEDGPPSEWLYEGEEPPTGFPGEDTRWSQFGADPWCPNW